MDDPADTRLPRIAPLLLVAVLVGLAVVRPGNLGGPGMPVYWLLTTLTAVAAVGYVAWRFHGLIPAAAAIVLLRVADPSSPPYAAVGERGWDAIALATLALGIAAGSRQGRPGRLPWLLLGAGGAALAYFGWYGWEQFAPVDAAARVRMQHVTAGLAVLAVVVGMLARGTGWRDRARLVAVAVLLPATGIAAARLILGDWPPLVEAGDWKAVPVEWQTAVRDGTWHHAAWCWTTPWVVVPLIGVGLWRTVARGWKGMKKGRPPLAWLIAAAALGAVAAVGARPLASGSLILVEVGALLSVFGVADLVLALIERIELKPPEPGPSGVPRVK